MERKGVYVVRYSTSAPTLTVDVEGKQVPMEEFVKNHEPIQVTSLTEVDVHGPLTVVGLLIAKEARKPLDAAPGH